MAKVGWTQAAQANVREIRRYIAHDSPAAAATVVRRLRAEAARLARYPESGRIVIEYADPAIREVIVSPYRLIYQYRPERDEVQIIAVMHGSRLLPPIMGED